MIEIYNIESLDELSVYLSKQEQEKARNWLFSQFDKLYHYANIKEWNELVRIYGEFEEKTELQNSRDRKEISYKWFTMDAENVDTYLYLDVVSNEERVFYISLAVGENIDIGSL